MANNTKRDVARELARRYSTMTHDELDLMEDLLIATKYPKGQHVVTAGDISDCVYWVDKGLVREFYTKNGKEVTEYLATENNIFMCIESLFKNEPSRMQVETLEPSIIYAMPKKQLEQVALHSVNIQILYRKILEESLILSQVHADLVRFESAQERYKRLMKMNPELFLRAPLVYIASYLQMTPETLSRVRSNTLID